VTAATEIRLRQVFNAGPELQRLADLQRAEPAFRQALAVDPANAHVLYQGRDSEVVSHEPQRSFVV
jgi:hypothetical protein